MLYLFLHLTLDDMDDINSEEETDNEDGERGNEDDIRGILSLYLFTNFN
jgi:hypothetical protein